MKESVLQVYLHRVRLFLSEKYNLDVQLIEAPLSFAKEIAHWSNSRLIIDIRERGTMGTLFIMCHVFGHLVQYATTKKYSNLLAVVNSRPLPLDLDDDFKKRYFVYEKEAFQIGKGLMVQVIDVDSEFDKLYQIFMYADYEHFWQYLVTGHSSSREEFHKRFADTKREMYKKLKDPLLAIIPPDELCFNGPIEIIVV